MVLNLVTSTLTMRTYIHTYIHMNVIRSACSKVILIYRDVKTCTELCVIKSVYIAGATVCINCDAGKYSAVVGASTCSGSVCAAGTHGPAGSTSSAAAACTSCPAGKYSATAGVESVCVVCVCVF